MPQVCLYLQLHQPYRLADFNIFDISNHKRYFSKQNKKIFQKVAKKSYLPMLRLLLKLSQKYNNNFKFALSCSGLFLEQALAYQPKIIKLLQDINKLNNLEFLAETYYHSLASLYSEAEFEKQIKLHSKLIKKLFNYTPKIFRNTELVYSNQIADQVAKMGFKGMLTEAVDKYLTGRDRTQIYFANLKTKKLKLPLLLKHAPLSDDIAFRFSDKNWPDYPLNINKYLKWIDIYPANHIINLFMDFETFGEHQWEDTGIFEFFKNFVKEFINKKHNKFVLPGEILTGRGVACNAPHRQNIYHVPKPISWADIDRDLTAWLGNDLQQDCINKLYKLETKILKTKNKKIINNWRKLQASDHFYYMCTKWSADGDVHAYFSPYDSPFEAYRRYSIVLADLYELAS